MRQPRVSALWCRLVLFFCVSVIALPSSIWAADTTPPVVTITYPANGATIPASGVTLQGTATDNVGVLGVNLSIWDMTIGGYTFSANDIPVNATTGAWMFAVPSSALTPTHQLEFSVIAYDAQINVSLIVTSTVMVQAAVDTTPPTAPGQPTEGGTTDLDYDADGSYSVYWAAAADAESGVAAYELQERAGATGAWATLTNTNTTLTFAVTGRVHNTRYYYQARAKNGAGIWGPWSPASDGMLVDKTAPAAVAVTDDGAGQTSTTQLHAAWAASSDAESGIARYEYIIRQDSTVGTIIVNYTSAGTATSVARTGLALTPGKNYYIGVRAVNRAGSPSAVTYADGITIVLPAYVLTAESQGALGGGTARFYKDGALFYSGVGGGGGGRSFNVATFSPSTGLLLQPVQNFDLWGGGAPAATALNSFLNTQANGTVIMFAIADEAGLTNWGLNNCTHLASNSANTAYVSLEQTLRSLGSTQIGNYCYWGAWSMITVKGETQARAEQLVNASASPAAPAIVTATIGGPSSDTTPPSVPGQPTEGSPDQAYDADGSFTVYWAPSSDAQSGISAYELQERRGAAGTWATLFIGTPASGTNFSVSGRTNGTVYYYQVRAKNGAGLWSGFSLVSSGITVDTQKPTVSLIGITNITANGALLNWTTSETTTCTVKYGITSPPATAVSPSPTGTSFNVTLAALQADTTIYVTASCLDRAGNAAPVAGTSFKTGPMLVPNLPSVVFVNPQNTRQLMLQRRNPDGTLAPAAPYVIRGVNWSPASTTTNTSPGDPGNAVKRRPEFGIWYQTDLPLMQSMNVNTVRLYLDPGYDATQGPVGQAVLDECYHRGIMVIMTVDGAVNDTARAQQVVNFYKNHPAILMWNLGNEWNSNNYYGKFSAATNDAAVATQSAAALVKSLDANHPVATTLGEFDLYKVNGQLNLQNLLSAVPGVDVWSFNLYRGDSAGLIYQQWLQAGSKPMFVAEFGIDAFKVTADANYNAVGVIDEASQAQWDQSIWNDVARNLSASDPVKTALGGFVFEWNDEWWKYGGQGSSSSSQDSGRVLMEAQPDGWLNDEFFGIVDINRNKRQVFGVLQALFAPGYLSPAPSKSLTLKAASLKSLSLAKLYKNKTLVFARTGGGGGGRGFNLLALNKTTGESLQLPQNFDTWASSTAQQDLINAINALPSGALIAITVADDAALTGIQQGSYCTPRTYVEPLYQALESLGSTMIRSYCYRDTWAVVAVKGEGTVRSEQIGHGQADAVAEALITLP